MDSSILARQDQRFQVVIGAGGPAARLSEVAEAVIDEARRRRCIHLARAARRRGRRLGTVSARSCTALPAPFHLPVSGNWAPGSTSRWRWSSRG